MKSKIFKNFWVFFLLQIVVSCGYFSDESVPKGHKKIAQNCQLLAGEFSKILTEDIGHQIDCLETNFKKFSKYVKRENNNSISKKDLNSFIQKFFMESADQYINGAELLFKINSILLGGNTDIILNKKISPLFDVLRNLNKHSVKINFLLKKLNSNNYLDLSDQIYSEVKNLSNLVLNDLKNTIFKGLTFNIRDLTSLLARKFKINNDSVDSFLFLKRIFLGGREDQFTRKQLAQFFKKLPQFVKIALDFKFLPKKYKERERKLFQYYAKSIEEIEPLVFHFSKNENVLKIEDLTRGISFMTGQHISSEKAHQLLASFKKNIIKTNSSVFSFNDIQLSLQYIKVAISFMYHQVSIKKKIKDLDLLKNSHSIKRSIRDVVSEIKDFSSFAIKLEKKRKYLKDNQDYLSFVLDLKKSFPGKSKKLNQNTLISFFSLKPWFLGGETKNFNLSETKSLLKDLPSFVESLLRIKYIKMNSFDLSYEKYSFLLKELNFLKKLIRPHRQSGAILKKSDLFNIINYSTNNQDFNIYDFSNSIDGIKEKLLGGTSHFYTLSQMHKVFDLLIGAMETGLYFDSTYNELDWLLRKTLPIVYVPKTSLPIYQNIRSSKRASLRKKFVHQARSYKYFRNKEGIAYYDHSIKRNKSGFVESALINYTLDLIQKVYGEESSTNKWSVSPFILRGMLLQFRQILIKLKMWTLNFDRFISNIVLLSDLFQNSSNGTMKLELDETTEFGILVLQAKKLSSGMIKGLKELEDSGQASQEGQNCRYTYDPEDIKNIKFPLSCHRYYFFSLFLEKLNYKVNFPKFYKFYKSSSQRELQKFLKDIEGFSRGLKDPNTPLAKRDFGVIIGSLINIESTFIRFDKNNDNILDQFELEKSFSIYRKAIIKVAKLSEANKPFAKSIFYYMIKNMKIPSKAELLNFHYSPFVDNKVSAKRTHLAALLYYLVKKNK